MPPWQRYTLWGGQGAAVATLLADLFIVSQYFRVYRRIGQRVECPALWSSLVAGCAMALACFVVPHSRWYLNAAASLLVYFVVLAVVARRRLADSAATFRQCFIPAHAGTLSNGSVA